jgi:hypothetical protein
MKEILGYVGCLSVVGSFFTPVLHKGLFPSI